MRWWGKCSAFQAQIPRTLCHNYGSGIKSTPIEFMFIACYSAALARLCMTSFRKSNANIVHSWRPILYSLWLCSCYCNYKYFGFFSVKWHTVVVITYKREELFFCNHAFALLKWCAFDFFSEQFILILLLFCLLICCKFLFATSFWHSRSSLIFLFHWELNFFRICATDLKQGSTSIACKCVRRFMLLSIKPQQ